MTDNSRPFFRQEGSTKELKVIPIFKTLQSIQRNGSMFEENVHWTCFFLGGLIPLWYILCAHYSQNVYNKYNINKYLEMLKYKRKKQLYLWVE